MNLPRPFTLPFCTPPHASTPSRCSCQRCKKDNQCPKLFSSDNNMYPGSVPAELQGLSQTEEMLIARSCPIMRVIHLKGGQLGSDARPNQLQQKSPTGSLAPAVPVAITPTFSPWTHTSDDSYIYQLSLVLATAIVSSSPFFCLFFSPSYILLVVTQIGVTYIAYDSSISISPYAGMLVREAATTAKEDHSQL